MRKEDANLLRPGTKVLIGDRLLGGELYGIGDPQSYQRFLGQTGKVVNCERNNRNVGVFVSFDDSEESCLFLIEEIDSIACDAADNEIAESGESLLSLFG